MTTAQESQERFAKACAALAVQKSQLSAREERLRAAEAKARHTARMAEFNQFANEMERTGRAAKGTGNELAALLASFADSEPVCFSEGGRRVSKDPAEFLMNMVSSRPP